MSVTLSPRKRAASRIWRALDDKHGASTTWTLGNSGSTVDTPEERMVARVFPLLQRYAPVGSQAESMVKRISEDSVSTAPSQHEVYKSAKTLADNYGSGTYTSLTAGLAGLRYYYVQGGGALKVFSGGGIVGAFIGVIVTVVTKVLT